VTNLEKAQAWVNSRADGTKEERFDDEAFNELVKWEVAAHKAGVSLDDYASEKYAWVLRATELANSDDPFAIMTATELAFAERMCDLKPRVYLEGAELERVNNLRDEVRAEIEAENRAIELKRAEMERKAPKLKPSGASFEDMFP
jgi:hypothetical protein